MCECVSVHVPITQSHPPLCDIMDCSLPGSSVHGISQARILEQIAISFSRGSSRPRDWTSAPALAGRLFTTEPPEKPHIIEDKLLSLSTPTCPTALIQPWRRDSSRQEWRQHTCQIGYERITRETQLWLHYLTGKSTWTNMVHLFKEMFRNTRLS